MSLFNFSELPEETNSFAPLAKGMYPAIVEKVEWKQSQKNPQNEYMNVQFRITGDKGANKVIFNMYNLINTNETARNIAMHDIKKLLIATEQKPEEMQLATKEAMSEAVINKAVLLKLDIKFNDYKNEDQNVIKGYETVDTATLQGSNTDVPF